MASYQDIDSARLQSLLGEGGVTLVDVRSDDEVARGMIAGAVHIPLHLIPLRTQDLDGDAPLVIYCHSGMRSAQACAFLASQGRENLYNLRGGVLGWGAAGFALEPKR